MVQSAIIISSLVILTACSAYNDMKHMEKNTAEMNQTTREMSDTTRDMKVVTESMEAKTGKMSSDTSEMRRATESLVKKTSELNRTIADMAMTTSAMREDMRSMNRATDTLASLSSELDLQTNHLYHDNRQGQSLELRLRTLEAMKKARKQFAKIKYANFYFKAFEFQLWKNSGADDDSQLDYLRFQAAQEIIQTIDELVPEGKRSLSPLSEKSYMQDLYALSAALHVVNGGKILAELADIDEDDQEEGDIVMGREDHAPTGMLSLIYDALSAKRPLERGSSHGSDLRPYHSAILKFEEIALYILKVRVNFLSAIVIKQLSAADGEHLSWLQRMRMFASPWSAKTPSRNIVQLRYYGWILGEALATRSFLESLGVDCPMDATLKRVVRNMRLSEPSGIIPARDAAIRVIDQRFAQLKLVP